MSQELKNFLYKHKCWYKNGQSYTHVCIGPPWGRYSIPDKDLEEFLNLYVDSIDAEQEQELDLHLAEMATNIAPFILDIDIVQNGEDRQYSLNDIKNILSVANKHISFNYKTNDLNLLAFVLQKEKPNFNEKTGKFKDGFHIMYPYIGMSHQMRTHLIDEIKNTCEEKNVLKNINFINSFEDVFDKMIVKTPWLLYGSRKKSGSLYKLTHIFNKNMVSLDKSVYDNKKLVKVLSNRKFISSNGTSKECPFNLDNISIGHIEYIKCLYSPKIVKKNSSNDSGENNYSLKEIELAKSLTNILSVERATSYSKWISVCWALKNISNTLLPNFIEFSQKNPTAFDEYACKNVWNNAYVSSKGLSIKSLHFWAKQDDIAQYQKIIAEYLKK